MSAVDVLTTEEVHQIAYLTHHGWAYTSHSGWTKPGVTRLVSRWVGGSTCREEETSSFDDTEEAYWRQREVQDV